MKIFKTFCFLVIFGIIVILTFINVMGIKRPFHVVNLNFNSKNYFMNREKDLMVEEKAPARNGLSFRIHDIDTDSAVQLLHIEKGDDSTSKDAKKSKIQDFDEEKIVTLTTESTIKAGNTSNDNHAKRTLRRCSRNDMKLGIKLKDD